jgi:lysophospholipid acyltransferase (LPLAT)-like uncharacterized protein
MVTSMRIKPSPRLVHHAVWGLSKMLHVHAFGAEHLKAAARMSSTDTFVVCHWHQSLLNIIAPHHHLKVAALASRSRDGEITAAYLESIGIRAVRGSSSKGAATAVVELMRALREGWQVALNLDGPRGPFKQVKNGAIEIARRCQTPLVPIAARASREVSFKRSWDKFRVPLPGSSLAVCYGKPLIYPPEPPDAITAERRRRELAHIMHELEAEASRRVGRSDCYPLPTQLAWMLGSPSLETGI